MSYYTHQVAKHGQVHVNTVRIYEQWGYISPVKRAANGYRLYEDVHLLQLKIARLAFRCELIQNNLRKRATKIVQASGKEQFDHALHLATEYLEHLQREHHYILKSIDTVASWMLQQRSTSATTYSHKEIAQHLNVTEDVLRNWERNGLYQVARTSQNYRIYSEEDFERLLVIRALRSAHFSISSILRFVQQSEQNKLFDIKHVLNHGASQDIVHVTDQLELQIREAIGDIQELISLLKPHQV